jgi:hypothetical protein
MVPTSGFVGIADVGEVELNAARTLALRWDVTEFRSHLIAELRPKILESLNALGLTGDIPAWYSFLDSIADNYGADILLDTVLPWVTVIEPPGISTLLAPSHFREKVAQAREAVVVFGSHGVPWWATNFVRGQYRGLPRDAVIVPVHTAGFGQLGALRGNDRETESGRLEEMLSTDEYYGGERRERKPSNLLSATLSLVASALGVNVERLHEATWLRRNRTICARLSA